MHGTLVYANTAIDSTDGVINLGQHTDCLYIWNKSNSTSAIVELNGSYQVYIPHSPDQGSHSYHTIPGDYTTIKVVTAVVDLAVFAVG